MGRAISKTGISPNTISVLSVLASAFVPLFLCWYSDNANVWLLVGAAAFIQLRLLFNMLDGLVAIEGGKKSALGDLYNDVPDRIADVLIIVGLGLAVSQVWALHLAWLCAAGAVFTAYVRFVGASLLGEHRYLGPQAKQHRMFLCTFSLLLTAAAQLLNLQFDLRLIILSALWIMAVGIVITSYRRLAWIVRGLKAKD